MICWPTLVCSTFNFRLRSLKSQVPRILGQIRPLVNEVASLGGGERQIASYDVSLPLEWESCLIRIVLSKRSKGNYIFRKIENWNGVLGSCICIWTWDGARDNNNRLGNSRHKASLGNYPMYSITGPEIWNLHSSLSEQQSNERRI